MVKLKSAVILVLLMGVVAGSTLSAHGEELQGITAPSADISLSFVLAGRVADVLVAEGHRVKKDQLLARLDDEPEKIQSQQLKLLSADRTRILAAEAELAQKRVDLRKLELARSKGAASDWEVEHLRLNVQIARLALQTAILEQEQYQRRYAHSRSQLRRMRLVAPMEGIVENVSVEAGESIGALGPVIRLVKNDPLWIDVPVPSAQANDLTVGQPVWTSVAGGTGMAAPNGRIINISAVADAASDTLRVRVEVDNPMRRPAGERVTIEFSSPTDADTAARLKTETE
ncbi:efflux RND transporter periplasmic adaptor subunit [Desulfosarcina alkanivorans]|nr:efflux RND transporter periplasmic adaptor subunit [Desulfosarcina alkanivorans]